MTLASLASGIRNPALERGEWPHRPLWLALALAGVASAGAAQGPADRVRRSTDRLVGILNDPALATPEKNAERRRRAEDAIAELFDWAEMARSSLGAGWPERTEREKQEFVGLYGQLACDAYLRKVEIHSKEAVRYVGEKIAGHQARVRLEFTTRKGTEVGFVYSLRQNGDEWLVGDVAIDGVSFAVNYRAQFREIIERESYAGLLAALRAKCVALAESDALPIARVARAGRQPAREGRTAQLQSEDPASALGDPLQPVNRVLFEADGGLYAYGIEPAAKGYRAVAPETVRIGIARFFSNLGTPLRLACRLLQGDLEGAGTEAARFGVNSTAGVLGFGDPARTWLGLESRDATFGQTFGVWGMGPGWYLYWPILGPSSVRDTLGLPFDMILSPVEYLPGLDVVKEINETSLEIEEIESVLRAALDPYVAIRETFHQHSRYAIENR